MLCLLGLEPTSFICRFSETSSPFTHRIYLELDPVPDVDPAFELVPVLVLVLEFDPLVPSGVFVDDDPDWRAIFGPRPAVKARGTMLT